MNVPPKASTLTSIVDWYQSISVKPISSAVVSKFGNVPARCSVTFAHTAPSPSVLPDSRISVMSTSSFGVQTSVGRTSVVSISPTWLRVAGSM